MPAYIARRLLLIIPTLLGILLINFLIVQAAPGGPVERMISQIKGRDAGGVMAQIGASGGGEVLGNASAPGTAPASAGGNNSAYRGAQGLDPDLIKAIEKLYGFDQPAHVRFMTMLKNYAQFDFGTSFFRDAKVTELVIEKMPVSISLGLWSTLLVYLISIPLGIGKAVRHGSRFDVWSSTAIVIGYAIPGFLFAILLIVLFAGGNYFQWFPLRGLTSPDFDQMSFWQQVCDYFWHLALPVTALTIGSFATLTLLTKNSFLDEINKQYVVTARAKGLSENGILYGHVFRNAMLLVVSGFPAALIGILFTGAFLIEIVFSLDGLGLLGFEAVMNRDYPVMFGTLYLFTLVGLLLKIISDVTYMLIDPRIDFERRDY
jgi:microcin C transport system permease protein